MGYKRKPKQYRLKFQDPDMEGFECLTRSCSVDEFTEITRMTVGMSNGSETDIRPMFDKLADVILEWNLEDDNSQPIPISAGTLRKEDIDFSMEILMAWMGAVASVDSPLLSGLKNGEIPPEVSQQLASLSRSLPNS